MCNHAQHDQNGQHEAADLMTFFFIFWNARTASLAAKSFWLTALFTTPDHSPNSLFFFSCCSSMMVCNVITQFSNLSLVVRQQQHSLS